MISPLYFDTRQAIKRLLNISTQHYLVTAFDFDDTICDNNLVPHEEIINLIKDCKLLGFHVIIYTARDKEDFPFIRKYLAALGINDIFINENAVQTPYGNHGKILYNIFLDDRAGLKEAYYILRTTVDILLGTSKL